MNGAHALIETLVASGVDVCFANPGTSEMHFVAALDDVPEMRAVLGLFEGVVTGAADGYARMAGKPACCLLHLGPGLGNGLANLHNARRAHSPIVAIVGDHATYHQQYDAPLESDIDSVARTVSVWVRRSTSVGSVGDDAAASVAAARAGGVATLILPADVSWSEGGVTAAGSSVSGSSVSGSSVSGSSVEKVAKVLVSGDPCALLLGGAALRRPGLEAASRVAIATGAKLLGETFPARLERGAGIPAVERLAYLGEMAQAQLEGVRHLILVAAKSPVSFFAYPDKPSDLVPAGCEVHLLGPDGLAELADRVAAGVSPAYAPLARPAVPTGPLTAPAVADAIGALLPEGAIVSDEGNTSGLWASLSTAGAPPHDWLTLTGGAIGQGLPLATGAAIACPDRKVLCLEADGSAMYTLQALWTQARERLDVTTLIFSNRSYAILNMELGRVGAAAPGPKARSMLDLSNPDLDFVALARGMGVDAVGAATAEQVVAALERAFATPGPHLIDAVISR